MKNKRIVSISFLILYIITLIIAVIINHYNGMEAIEIFGKTMQGIAGIVIIFSFEIVEKMFKIEIAQSIRIILLIFTYCAIFLGTNLDFYRLIPSWDIILHFSSGILFTFIAFIIVKNLFLNDLPYKKNYILSLTMAVFISFSIAYLWELFEFTCDSLFHGNSQRFIPEVDGIFNGGDSSLNLNGDKDLIYDFFIKPEGYRYALMDTMIDMTVCFLGTMISTIGLTLAYKHVNEDSFQVIVKAKTVLEMNKKD